MNATELADLLESMTTGWFVNDWKLLTDSAAMLRQQQAEIEALKQSKSDGNNKVNFELTDEEIMVLYEEYIETQYASESNVLGFGRAILRKACDK